MKLLQQTAGELIPDDCDETRPEVSRCAIRKTAINDRCIPLSRVMAIPFLFPMPHFAVFVGNLSDQGISGPAKEL
jgi:hypothetical protein